jgi:formylglycine-generating enzyme required for sulfatase activity
MTGALLIGAAAACATGASSRPSGAPAGDVAAVTLEPYRDSIPGTLVRFDMIPVRGGTVTVETPTGPRPVEVPSFWIGRTEVTWDEYDVFAFRLDMSRADAAAAPDAESRPSRPYGAPDRGYGHDGYPALGMTYQAAVAYAAWLSAKTGHSYRVPTDAQWTLAATAGARSLAGGPSALAWHSGNAGETPHPVGVLRADALGLHDMFGNVAEWVTGADGRPVVRGGSFVDPPASVGIDARAYQTEDWNSSDPQFPKSRWWLSDAPFVGFRLVREP